MYDEKAKRRTMKYLAKLKEIRFRVTPEEYEKMQKTAKKLGYESMRQFFLAAIDNMMYNEGVEGNSSENTD